MARLLTNDILRSLRYMLDLSENRVLDLLKLAQFEASRSELQSYLKKDDEAGYLECPEPVLAHFLEGLIFYRRGQDDQHPARPIELPINNNLVLKKLRVAFELQEQDLVELLQSVGFNISKGELSALFRKEGHKNYRPCGDQFLRNLLKGLTLKYRSK
jgi:uncharacterized protein YehS (DUF1456 family)